MNPSQEVEMILQLRDAMTDVADLPNGTLATC